MLFDLQGKRRRAVQATYLTLAVLMGGGLVLFGIGGEVSGGLVDAFTEGDNSGDASSLVQQRVERAETRLKANPKDEAALAALVRSRYQLASDSANPNTGAFSNAGKVELRRAASAWQRYLALDPSPPDDGLASYMLQAYGEGGLNQPEQAVVTAEIVSEARPTPQSYLLLARYASLSGQTRKATLAGEKAVELSPRADRRLVREQVKQATTPAPTGTEQPGG